ncbi:granzyme E-like [Mastomys coucha]|uniref:granzyme E-like n=1 Tax=Mastomys coucha TaxID=35658 RepID=UPI0012626AF1|nr:granzyme E-like [Mastomys coucha]
MAYVKFLNTDGKKSACGGFLVQDNFVLTAAHCNGSSLHSSMIVKLGAHNLAVQEKTLQIIPVAKAIPHPAYNHMDHTNDIMLLKLESKAKRTKAVRPIKLPRHHAQVKPGQECHFAGWGNISINATKGSARLQEAELIIQEDEECKKRFRHYFNTIEICAGNLKKMQAAFKGDSGGPLVYDNKAYGVLSYVKENRISPGIFSRLYTSCHG